MPENCYMGVFEVKEFVFDVKIAKISLLHGENLILNFDESPTFGANFKVWRIAATTELFVSLQYHFRLISIVSQHIVATSTDYWYIRSYGCKIS